MKYLIHICLLCTNLLSFAGVVQPPPTRTIEDVPDGIVVTYFFNDPEIVESEYYENTKYIRYDGFGLNDNDGEPCIPFRNDTYLVPNNCAVTVSVLDSAYSDTTFVLSPSMPIMPDNGSLIAKHTITPYSGFFPINIIHSSGVYLHREDALISVSISPVKYNYQTNTVRRYSLIKYKLTYSGTNYKYNGKSTSLARKICQNTSHSRSSADSTIRDDRHYLIITTTEYKDCLEDFVRWKRLKGYNVHIASRPKGSWTTDSVLNVVNGFLTGDSIKYLLIVGDVDDVPGVPFTYSYWDNGTYITKEAITDYEYGRPTLAGIPQISRGRIPVNNTIELSTFLRKVIKYEQTPIIDDEFYNTALHLAQFQDGSDNYLGIKDSCEDRAFTLCAEELRNYLITNYEKIITRGYTDSYGAIPTYWNKGSYSFGDTIPSDLRDGAYNWTFKAKNIKDAVEAGTFYVFYRGHGQEVIWNSPGFPGIPALGTYALPFNNGEKLPFVFSIACLTGKYNYESGDCLAEKLLKNQNQSGGCIGVIAATEVSFSGYNDAMAYGMFDAIWPDFTPTYRQKFYNPDTTFTNPTYEVGDFMDIGLMRMSKTWGITHSSQKLTTWKLFHCFADPSTALYTENPQYLQDPIIRLIGDSIYVNVLDAGCRINIVSNTTNEVHSYLGNNVAQYVGGDDISVCIDKHNHVPYVWGKDIYIQNEDILSAEREYHAKNVKVGKHVTDLKPQGNVTITNSNVTIKANNVLLDKGTYINVGSTLNVKTSY